MIASKPVEILHRIRAALVVAAKKVAPYALGHSNVSFKFRDDPVTEADRLLDTLLHDLLVRDGEGWLSEESEDDLTRLDRTRVWVVDPLDGTREFVQGIPEWCISIGYVENGRAVAGGICNPATGETFLGSLETGVTLNGKRVNASSRKILDGASVLASRSELKRGDWHLFRNPPFNITPMGSVAYKLARVAAGLADATWTLCPKHEWDVAAGVALCKAAGGFVCHASSALVIFNNRSCILPDLLASGPYLAETLFSYVKARTPVEKAQEPSKVGFSARARHSQYSAT